ncbi:MAG: hypothetical protein OJF49_000162 [Ktedonobacterales bacterium]|jgi:cytochrome c-type biogenesis protein CcmH|nr:MAG: hypothetical protein OJF49_000162 [Ktedonobacterales bacterium]
MNWTSLIRRPAFLIALAVLIIIGLVWGITAVRAAQPLTLDQHVYSIANQLQCPVCNGESVADSPSPVAQEIRSVIREQIIEGKSDQQILSYFHQHYGDSILESPPKQGFTSLIWLAPIIMLLAGLVLLWSVAREWNARPKLAGDPDTGADTVLELTADERQRYLRQLQHELDLETIQNLPATKEVSA